MSSNYRPTIHKPCLFTLTDGLLKLSFKDKFDYLGFSLHVLTLESNFLQEDETSTLQGRAGGGSSDAEILLKN